MSVALRSTKNNAVAVIPKAFVAKQHAKGVTSQAVIRDRYEQSQNSRQLLPAEYAESYRAGKTGLATRVAAGGAYNASNPYLHALLDPEGTVRVGVPDEVYAPTARIQSVTQFDMDYDVSGAFALVVRPDHNAQAMVTSTTATVNEVALMNFKFPYQADLTYGEALAPMDVQTAEQHHDQLRGLCQKWGKMSVAAGEKAIFDYPRPTGTTADGHLQMYPYKLRDPSGVPTGDYKGCAVPITGGSVKVRLFTSAVPDTFTGSLNANFYREDGTIRTIAFAVLNKIDDAGVLSDIVGWRIDDATPGNTSPYIYLEIENATNVDIVIKEINMYGFSLKPGKLFPTTLVSSPLADDFNRNAKAFRVVSMSVLVTYFGNMLDNDLIAIRHVATGADPFDYTDGNFFEQGTLAQQPSSYSGPLQKGAYGVWAPSSIAQATKWRGPLGDLPDWHSESCLVVAGHATTTAQAIRVRIVTNFELMTDSRIYSPTPYISTYPDEMAEALKAFATFCPVGENNTHLKRIAEFFKKNGPRALKLLWNNRAPIATLIGTAASGGDPMVGRGVGEAMKLLPNW